MVSYYKELVIADEFSARVNDMDKSRFFATMALIFENYCSAQGLNVIGEIRALSEVMEETYEEEYDND